MICEGSRQSVATMIFLFLGTLGYIGSRDDLEWRQIFGLGLDIDARPQ